MFRQVFLQVTDLIMKFFLECWGKVCGHLSNSITGSITDPWVLNMGNIQFFLTIFHFYNVL